MTSDAQGSSPNVDRLTKSQRLIWAGQQLHPTVPMYNMAFVFVIERDVDPRALAAAFDRLLAETDALRSVITQHAGAPRRHVRDSVSNPLSTLDLSDQPQPRTALFAWAESRCQQALDLTTQVFDAALVRLGDQEWALYLNQHHVACDAWSSGVLFRRLEVLYRHHRDPSVELPSPPVPYDRYLSFEANAAQIPESPHWQLFRQQPAAPVSLFGHRPPPGETANVRVDRDPGEARWARARALIQQADFRAFTPDLALLRVLTTVTVAYAARLSGESVITVGLPTHNRTPAFRSCVGLLVEVLPVRVEVEANDTFHSLFAKTRDAIDATMRAYRPGLSDATLTRGMNVVLNYIRADFGTFDGAPVHTRWLHPQHVDEGHHLRLQVHDFNGRGRPTLSFDLARGIAAMAEDQDSAVAPFFTLLDAMLDDVDQPVADVGLAELLAANASDASGPAATFTPFLSAFAASVQQNADAVAMIAGDRSWTYRALDAAAARFSARVGPQDVVGVCLPRSAEAVIAVLGVVRAGGAFVPLDPEWPADHLGFIIDDAQLTQIIAAGPVSSSSSSERAVPVLSLDEVSAGPADAPPADRAPGDLAYILYTSGSTGRPKGVAIEHGALASYVSWASAHYDRGRQLAFALFTSLTFDLSLTSLFVPLASGGRVVVYPRSEGFTDLAVQTVFAHDQVDIVKLTPSHLALVQDRDMQGARIRQLILGGEELTTALARRVTERFGGQVAIHNEYGPTEATVGCLVHTFAPDADTQETVPVGQPIAGVRALVLDAGRHPVPVGVPGDLWVAGPGLARGYVGRDDLTRERFVEIDGKVRAYNTGDRARLRPDGVFEFLGRTDDQVKVRGHRIELGEVEGALMSVPGIAAAAASVYRRQVPAARAEQFCTRCGLSSEYPGVTFDENGVCDHCRSFDRYVDRAQVYFKSMPELDRVFAEVKKDPDRKYDCMVLLSGGKDSTYMLCQLVDMGLRVLSFTLDNGYISDQAKANIQRVVDHLGVDHVFGETPAMNEIFVDSLHRHANVCHGCFKAIYTLATTIAVQEDIPFIVTGLSRGQFFETRLTEDLFTRRMVSAEQIDADVLEARRAYHAVDDASRRLLDVRVFDNPRVFEDVRFVDFYRYCDVDLDELLAYLRGRVPWVRPTDTGRSTNCRINDVGIYVHKRLRGYHNYALPYSWDVRLGHKTRDAAMDELDDEIDEREVQRILREIGYPDDLTEPEPPAVLLGYYVAEQEISPATLREHLQARLPAAMVPARFIRLAEMPLTPNGKVDRRALPAPGSSRPEVNATFAAPTTDAERGLCEVWREVLDLDRVGVDDDFFQLGGDSIAAIRIAARAHGRGLVFALADLFEARTVRLLASKVDQAAAAVEEDIGPVPLTPAQLWLLEQPDPAAFVSTVRFVGPTTLTADDLRSLLAELVRRHAALRQSFASTAGGWTAEIRRQGVNPPLRTFDVSVSRERAHREMDEWLAEDIALTEPSLLRAALVVGQDGPAEIALSAHRVAIDPASWGIMLDELERLWTARTRKTVAGRPAPSATLSAWVESLTTAHDDERDAWLQVAQAGAPPMAATPSAQGGQTMVEVAAEPSRLLLGDASTWRVTVDEVLLAAMATVLTEARPAEVLRVFVEGHLRSPDDIRLDATDTVGALTSLYPVLLEGVVPSDLRATVQRVKDSVRSVPRNGAGYGALRYLSPDPRAADLALDPRAHALFSYVRPRPADSPRAFKITDALNRPYHARDIVFGLEVHATVHAGRLMTRWRSSVVSEQTVRQWAHRFTEIVAATVEAFTHGPKAAATASDFPLAGLSNEGLGALAKILNRRDT